MTYLLAVQVTARQPVPAAWLAVAAEALQVARHGP